MKQWYVFEMNGFTEEESQRLFNKVFSKIEWAEEHSMGISHLTDKGVANLKKHVFKQGVNPMKKIYEVSVHGCDDSTTIRQELTFEEYEFLNTIAEKITNTSEYGCMPIMEIEETNE